MTVSGGGRASVEEKNDDLMEVELTGAWLLTLSHSMFQEHNWGSESH